MSQSPQQSSPFLLGPEQTNRACLLIHGFAGSPAEMRLMGEALAHQGMKVYGVRVQGHGGTPEDLVTSTREQWLASVEEGLALLAHFPNIFVIGFSMGGALALLLAVRHPERIKGVIALAPLARMTGNPLIFTLPIARYFIKWFYPLQALNFNDPKVQAEVLKQAKLRDPNVKIDFSDPQTVNYVKQMVRLPIPALAELYALTAELRRNLQYMYLPLLIIQSERDQTVAPACAEEVYHLARVAKPKYLYWLEQSDHLITIGPERERVFAWSGAFIDEVSPPGAAEDDIVSGDQVIEPDGSPPDH